MRVPTPYRRRQRWLIALLVALSLVVASPYALGVGLNHAATGTFSVVGPQPGEVRPERLKGTVGDIAGTAGSLPRESPLPRLGGAAPFVSKVLPQAPVQDPGGQAPGAARREPPGLEAPPDPVDPRSWVLPEQMTWDDYRPIPGYSWNDPSLQPPVKLRGALILADFPDQTFAVTLPPGADPAGNPKLSGSVPRDRLCEFWTSFLNKPQELNNFRSINEYWLENSYGLVGVELDCFGPYRMEYNEFQYGLNEFGQGANCPPGYECNKDFDTELLQKSLPDFLAATALAGQGYHFRFFLHAGYCESGTWQEFGEMMFLTKDEVTDPFGPPDPGMPNWARTRYVEWTSWWAAKGIWSHAVPGVLSTQGENSGQSVYAHEFSHILGVLDNYNNPYADPVSRSYSGPWDMMSRGTFNGPGGPHTRWVIPPTAGGSAGPHHMLRNKIRMGLVRPGEVLLLERDDLALTGPVFADIWARSIPLGPGTGRTGLRGIQIALATGDKSPPCTLRDDWRCDRGGYHNYTVEVVDRMGYDSFAPDHGVLIAKTKNADLAPFVWVIDAHPEDIQLVDFYRPDGTPAMISKGDYRQLVDALFKAGTGPGVVSEYVDEHNRLHFYVLDKKRDFEGVLSYRVAVRHLDGGGPFPRGVALGRGDSVRAAPGRVAVYWFKVANTGPATDLVRLTATTEAGWEVTLLHNVIEVKAGQTVDVPVYVSVPKRGKGRLDGTTLTFTVTSETDPTKTVTRVVEVVPVRPAAGGPEG